MSSRATFVEVQSAHCSRRRIAADRSRRMLPTTSESEILHGQTRLLHSMARDGLKRGVVTLCIGGGWGIALALERV